MRKTSVYVSYPDHDKLEKIGVVNSTLSIGQIIQDFAQREAIEFTQLMTNIGNKGINTHAIRDNFDLLFISKEEAVNDDDSQNS